MIEFPAAALAAAQTDICSGCNCNLRKKLSIRLPSIDIDRQRQWEPAVGSAHICSTPQRSQKLRALEHWSISRRPPDALRPNSDALATRRRLKINSPGVDSRLINNSLGNYHFISRWSSVICGDRFSLKYQLPRSRESGRQWLGRLLSPLGGSERVRLGLVGPERRLCRPKRSSASVELQHRPRAAQQPQRSGKRTKPAREITPHNNIKFSLPPRVCVCR